jgi:hypothetical protein
MVRYESIFYSREDVQINLSLGPRLNLAEAGQPEQRLLDTDIGNGICTSCDVCICSSIVGSASFPFVLQAYAPHTKDTAPVHTMGMEDAPDHGTVDGSIVTMLIRVILVGDIGAFAVLHRELTSRALRYGGDKFCLRQRD